LHIKENLSNFLYDLDYFITIYEKNIHIFNYQELLLLNNNEIKLKLNAFKITIKGENLFIKKMLPNEILISGIIENVGFTYE